MYFQKRLILYVPDLLSLLALAQAGDGKAVRCSAEVRLRNLAVLWLPV